MPSKRRNLNVPTNLPQPKRTDDILKRFISTMEKLILFLAFDFTIENWKQYLPQRLQPQNKEIGHRKISMECIHRPTDPPRNSPRKNVRGKIKTFDKPDAFKMQQQQKSQGNNNKKWKPSSNALKVGGITSNRLSSVMEINESAPSTPITTNPNSFAAVENEAAIIDSGFNSPEIVPNLNPLLDMIIQPLKNLWSSSNSSLMELNDHQPQSLIVAADDSQGDKIDDNNEPQKTLNEMEIEELRKRAEEILIQNPENFIETEIAQELAARLNGQSNNNKSEQPLLINQATNQKINLLAETDAAPVSENDARVEEDILMQQRIPFNLDKDENLGNNFCVKRTTTFQLEPLNSNFIKT